MTDEERQKLRALILNNVERVEWTLQDPNWKPSREYLEKLLASYKAHTAILLGAPECSRNVKTLC